MKTYKPSIVCKVVRLERKTFDQQVQRGIITASVPSTGIGVPNLYTINDMAVMLIANKLRNNGFNLKESKRIAELYRDPAQCQNVFISGLITICVDMTEYHSMVVLRINNLARKP